MATLDDVRAEVMATDRLNAIVFGGFAAVALAIAVVGVAAGLALGFAAIGASLMPASRASRIDVMQALRTR